MRVDSSCLFCRIVSGELEAVKVFEDDLTLGFLDHRPLFRGHTLIVPREHYETLSDLPTSLIDPLFKNVQQVSKGVEAAMEAEGTFVALNNRVSQSVPHLHVHIVPRRKKDGLKGFFWPRTKYASQDEMLEVREKIMAALLGR